LAILITKNYYRLDVEHLDYYKPNTSFVNLIYKNFPNTSVRKDVLRKILTDVVVRSHLALDTGIKGNVSAKKLISQLEKSNDVLDREVKRFFRSFLYPNTLAYTILIED
jgi:hypothetical protein